MRNIRSKFIIFFVGYATLLGNVALAKAPARPGELYIQYMQNGLADRANRVVFESGAEEQSSVIQAFSDSLKSATVVKENSVYSGQFVAAYILNTKPGILMEVAYASSISDVAYSGNLELVQLLFKSNRYLRPEGFSKTFERAASLNKYNVLKFLIGLNRLAEVSQADFVSAYVNSAATGNAKLFSDIRALVAQERISFSYEELVKGTANAARSGNLEILEEAWSVMLPLHKKYTKEDLAIADSQVKIIEALAPFEQIYSEAARSGNVNQLIFLDKIKVFNLDDSLVLDSYLGKALVAASESGVLSAVKHIKNRSTKKFTGYIEKVLVNAAKTSNFEMFMLALKQEEFFGNSADNYFGEALVAATNSQATPIFLKLFEHVDRINNVFLMEAFEIAVKKNSDFAMVLGAHLPKF